MDFCFNFTRGGSARALAARLCAVATLSLGLPGMVANAWGQPPTVDASYHVKAGDVLQVTIEGHDDISGEYTVEKSGAIVLRVLGSVPVSGRTTAGIGTDIARRMSLISTKVPSVVVRVVAFQAHQYFVLGAVLLPGMYEFSEPPNVWGAIAEAGGPADDADLTSVEVLSQSQTTPTVVNLANVKTSDLENLPPLRPGDTVRVRRVETTLGTTASGEEAVVYVFGAVGTQGALPLVDAPDLVRALMRSVPTADANLERVDIVRKNGLQRVNMRVNLERYFREGGPAGNPALQAGDTVRLSRQGGFSILRALGTLGTVVGLATSIIVLAR